jgi:hypothetical protein
MQQYRIFLRQAAILTINKLLINKLFNLSKYV